MGFDSRLRSYLLTAHAAVAGYCTVHILDNSGWFLYVLGIFAGFFRKKFGVFPASDGLEIFSHCRDLGYKVAAKRAARGGPGTKIRFFTKNKAPREELFFGL